jgi:hypothetical protein
MTFDNDMIKIETLSGPRYYKVKDVGLEWPPPEKIDFLGFPFQRVSISLLTDEQRANLSFVLRGAHYEPIK